MRKTGALLLLCALLLCACGKAAGPEPSLSPASQESPAADPAAQEQLSALLGELRQNVTIATAGSSLRAVAMAAKLLDWAENADITDEQIRAALEPWLAPLEDGVPADFTEQLQAVDNMVRLLTLESGQEAEGLLSDAGCDDCGYPWSEEAADTVARVMALAGVRDGENGG